MAKRKSLNKRSSRYSRGSGGSNVLNPDTNVFDDEQPYWWRHLENNTIVTRSTNSANFNQTSRRLNSNSSIGSNNDLDDGWWKVLEGTPRNLKSLQKGNDLSKKDANDGASRISESEDEVKIAKKKPQLRPEAKKVDGNAFLSALKDPQLLLIPVEKDVSIAQRFSLTTQKLPNKDSATKRRMAEHSNDLLNCPLPYATSTPLERSIASQGSNSDTEPLLKKMKPKAKLLRRHNRDTKKNLFENILMEDQTDIEEAAHRPSANASAAADKSAKESEPRIVENESKLEDASKRLHPTEKADHRDSAKYSSDTTYEFREPTKPKSRFLQRTPRENLFQRILSDSDSSITKPSSNHSQNRNSSQTMRRTSVISTESNEDVNLKLSVSSNSSDVDIIRTRNNIVPSVPETSRERTVSGNEKDRSVSLTFRTQLYSDSDQEEDDKASDVTLLTMTSKSLSVKNKSTISSENISTQPEIYPTQQSRKNSAANLTKVSVGNKDSAVAENAYGASDIEFPDLNRSRKRSISRSAQEIAAEEDPTSQPTKKSQKRSTSANFNEERTSSEAERSPRTSLKRQSKRSTTAQQRISSPANVEQTSELGNITPRRSKRSEAVRKTSETENVRTYEQESSSSANFNEERTSSEAERSPRTSLRRQSKRSTTAQQRISSPANVERTSELGNITPRRSKRSEAVRKTSETENDRTYEQESSSSANFNEERTSSEEEGSPQTSLRRQSKRSTTAQQRISSPANVEQTRELGNITPRRSKRSEVVRKTSETENVRTYEQERSSRANLNEERTSSQVERSPRTSLRRQSKRSTTAQQRISSPANVEQTRELGNITPRRSKRSEVVRKTSKTENVRTYEQESSSSANFNEERTSSEEEGSPRTSLRRQSKRSTTAQQRISSPANVEQTRELGNITPRRSKRSEVVRKTSETENIRTYEQESSSRANLNEERTSSQAERSPRTSLRRQSKRSTTAQQRISSAANVEQTSELGNITPRRSKRSEVVRITSKTEIVRTPQRKSRDAMKESEIRNLKRSLDRSMSRSAQEIAAEGTAVSQATMESQERSSPANINEDRTSSEEEPSAVTSRTAQQLGNTTSRRSKRSEAGRRTSETENVRTPRRKSRGAVKDSEFRDLDRSRERSMSRSAQEIAAEGTAMSQSTMESQERSSPANIDEDSTSSEEEPSAVTSRTAQQLGNTTSRRSKRSEAGRRTSETENVRTPERDTRNTAKVSELEGALQSRRSRQILVETQESPPSDRPGSDKARSSAARRTFETENDRTPERDSRNVAKVSELEGTLQSRRSRQILVETRETSPVLRPGSDKAKSSAAPKGRQKVIEDYFGTNATAIPASQALSNPEMAQEIRKKLDEMKKRELQRMEEKLPVVQKRNKGKGVRAKSNQVNPVPKKVDKAYLVNGVVYKQPRLPRPKKWVTDHLYRYLWKQMEPKYKLETRVKSEKFVRRLSEVSDEIAKRKSYKAYKDLLYALMKEMARLGLIRNRFDFYNFCHDFLPYELRAKMVPILLPGNMRTIPYDPKKLYDPLISP